MKAISRRRKYREENAHLKKGSTEEKEKNKSSEANSNPWYERQRSRPHPLGTFTDPSLKTHHPGVPGRERGKKPAT